SVRAVRGGAAPEVARFLEEHHPASGAGEIRCRRQPREPTTNDGHIRHRIGPFVPGHWLHLLSPPTRTTCEPLERLQGLSTNPNETEEDSPRRHGDAEKAVFQR